MTFLSDLRLLCEKHGVKLISGLDRKMDGVRSKIVAYKLGPDGRHVAEYEIPDILPETPKPAKPEPEKLSL